MIDFLFDVGKKALELGVDQWKKSSESRNAQLAVAGRLARELRLLEQLLLEFCESSDGNSFIASQSSDAERVYRKLQTPAFDEASKAPIPLKDLLPEHLQVEKGYTVRGRYEEYAKRIEHMSVADLVERCFLRLKVLQARAEAGLSLGDVDYVLFLVRSTLRTLNKAHHQP